MSYYLSRYIGKYRLKADIDLSTNDYPRDYETGVLEQTDVYIACQHDCRIYHYGKSILTCYVPSLGRGRNILKEIGNRLEINVESFFKPSGSSRLFDYDSFYKQLSETKVVYDIEETDEEVLWKINNKNLDFIIDLMKPLTSGASRSPFSSRNLPIKKYEIPNDEIRVYKEITDSLGLDYLVISHITKDFISNYIPSKHREYRGKSMSSVMKKECLRGKEFIHSIGMWDEFIGYLSKRVLEISKE